MRELENNMRGLEKKMRESRQAQWSDRFPWIWEMDISAPNRCVVTNRTFDSMNEFVDDFNLRINIYPRPS